MYTGKKIFDICEYNDKILWLRELFYIELFGKFVPMLKENWKNAENFNLINVY